MVRRPQLKPLTSADVRNVRFHATKFREGYLVDDVDAFLGEVAAALAHRESGRPGPAPLTAEQVRAARFRAVKFGEGYDQGEVDDFLQRVEVTLSSAAPSAPVGSAHGVGQGPSDQGLPGPEVVSPGPAAPAQRDGSAGAAPRPVTSDEVCGASFTGTWWRTGYDVKDVDGLLQQAVAALRHRAMLRPGEPLLAADDVRGARLRSVRFARGYDIDEVDALIDRIELTLRQGA